MKTLIYIIVGVAGCVVFWIGSSVYTAGLRKVGVPWEHRIYESGGQYYYYHRGHDTPPVPDPNTWISHEQYSVFKSYDYTCRFLVILGLILAAAGFGPLIFRGMAREMAQREAQGLKWWEPLK